MKLESKHVRFVIRIPASDILINIEIDGRSHLNPKTGLSCERRDKLLREGLGVQVIRIKLNPNTNITCDAEVRSGVTKALRRIQPGKLK